jgi:hypothetical protein
LRAAVSPSSTLWRNIAAEPVATQPLALCDAASVRPEDLVVFEIHYADRIGENYFAKHHDGHRCLPSTPPTMSATRPKPT